LVSRPDAHNAGDVYSTELYPIYDPAGGDAISFSKKKHLDYMPSLESDLVRLFYVLILRSTFCYNTARALASVGCEIHRQVYIKAAIQMSVESIALLKAGIDTLGVAIGHGMIVTGVDANEAYLTANAEFRMGVIVFEPKYMGVMPHAICNAFIGGRNNRCMTSYAGLQSNAHNRPAMMVVPGPVTENEYQFPVSLNMDPPYAAPDSDHIQPQQKGSWTHFLAAFFGDEVIEDLSSFGDETSFWESSRIAGALHRACTWYGPVGEEEPMPGTGALGPIGRNLPEAGRVYWGEGHFPTNFNRTLVY